MVLYGTVPPSVGSWRSPIKLPCLDQRTQLFWPKFCGVWLDMVRPWNVHCLVMFGYSSLIFFCFKFPLFFPLFSMKSAYTFPLFHEFFHEIRNWLILADLWIKASAFSPCFPSLFSVPVPRSLRSAPGAWPWRCWSMGSMRVAASRGSFWRWCRWLGQSIGLWMGLPSGYLT